MTTRSITQFSLVAMVAIVAFFAVGMFAHAATAPTITGTIQNSSNGAITTALVGASVHDVAMVASSTASTTPTGTVDFQVYQNTTCASTATTQSGVALVNGMATSSATVLGAGGLSYKVHYNSDANNVAADGPCQPLTATSNTASITTGLSSTTIQTGSSVTASSTLGNVTGAATGTVAYAVYTDNACTTALQGAGVVTVANGIVPNSQSVLFNNSGTFYFRAIYSGDLNNSAATSTCGSSVVTVSAASVNKATTTLSTALSTTTPVLPGTNIHDSATLSGKTANASGTVAYTVFTNNACTALYGNAGSQSVTNGIVPNSAPFLFNTAGTYYWQAVYSGDTNNLGATSTCTDEILTVSTASTSVPQGQGRLIVNKVTIPANDSTNFHFTTSGTGYSGFDLSGTSSANNQLVNIGTFSVSENSLSGWNLSSSTCARNGLATSTYTPGTNIALNANDTVGCTFTNTKSATTTTGPGTISGTVYNDKNKNELRDAGEEGIAGVLVNLYNSANFNGGKYYPTFKSTTTDVNGNYSFTGLPSGTYSIEQLKKNGWKQETDDYAAVTLTATGLSGLDFGDVMKRNGKCDNRGRFSWWWNHGNNRNCNSNFHKDKWDKQEIKHPGTHKNNNHDDQENNDGENNN